MEKNIGSRERRMTGVTVWGAVVNIALTGLKLSAGIWGRSAAMVADAIHSLTDLVSDAIVLVMVRIASKGSDKGHDYGHGKYETLATLCISLLLVVVAAKLMSGGIEKIKMVLSGGTLESPGAIALWAAVISVVSKEALYRWTAAEGRKVNSAALIANAWHHRSDALSSIGALVGIGGAMLLGGKWTVLDPITCCIISIFIIIVAVKMSIPALNELTDASLSDDIENDITATILSVEGVEDVHELKTRNNGPNIIIGTHIVVDSEMTVAQAHDITILIEEAIRKKFGPETQISIHVEPDKDAK